jgi:5'-nucleotidase (lipoprotein e(P4) family)
MNLLMNRTQISSLAMPRALAISAVFCTLLFSGSHLVVGQATAAPAQAGDSDYQTGAILWIQSSAEYRALAYQAFALARLRLDQDLRGNKARRGASQRAAVIVDVDETVLDNSRYQAELVLRGLSFDPETWRAWCERGDAGAVPGAVDFLNYAARRGVHIFYITNRRQAEKAGTIANLRKLGFPDPSEEKVMIREDKASLQQKNPA